MSPPARQKIGVTITLQYGTTDVLQLILLSERRGKLHSSNTMMRQDLDVHRKDVIQQGGTAEVPWDAR